MKSASKTTTGKLKKEEKNPKQEEVKKNDPMPEGNVVAKDDAPAPPIEKATEEVQPNPLENPFWLMEKALEKKLRNLKKRQVRLQQMKAEKEDGCFMPKQEQIEALNKIDEIGNQIAFVEEMQKLNQKQFAQYKKAIKVRDREQKKQNKVLT